MKAIIHIGTHKTGSSSIQKSLFNNQELLLKRGTIYPDIGSGFQHWGLFTAFMNEHPSNFHLLQNGGWGKEQSEKWSFERLELIRQYAKTDGTSYMIISAEDLHGINLKLQDFKYFLDDVFERYFIVLYGRCAHSYYSSYISEMIGQGVKTFGSPLNYKHSLTRVVNLWKSVFNDNFIVRPFSSESLVNGDIVDDFLEVIYKVLGVNLKPGFIKVNENISPSGTAIALLHFFNQQNNRFVENKQNAFWFNAQQLLRTCPASKESLKLSFSKEVREIIRVNNLLEWKQFIEICHQSCSKYGLFINEDSTSYEQDVTSLKNQVKEFDVNKWLKSYLTPEGLNYVITHIVNQYAALSKANSLLTETQQKLSSCSSQLQEKEALLEQISHQLEQKTKELEVRESLEKSITEYQHKIEITPNSSLFHHKLGETLANNKNFLDQAITEFKKAIELKPDSALSYGCLGEILIKQGLLEEAITYLKKAIEIKPKCYIFYNGLGLAFLKQESWDEAISCFEKAIELKADSAWAYYNLGLAFSRQEQLETASNYFAAAAKLNPSLLNTNLLDKHYYNYASKIGIAQWDVVQPIKCKIAIIESTSISDNSTKELCSFNIDRLQATDAEETVQMLLAGWIFGHKSKVISVQIFHSNSLIKTVSMNLPRPDVLQSYPDYNLDKNTGFNAYWNMLKSLISNKDEITVKAVFADNTSLPFQMILLGKIFTISDRSRGGETKD